MVFHGGISLKRLEKIVSLKMKILLAVAFAAAVFVCGGCKKAGEDEIFLETVAESCDGTDPHKQSVDQGRIFLKQKKRNLFMFMYAVR